MYTVLDIETTVDKSVSKGGDPSPYNKNNALVSVGYETSKGEVDYLFFFLNGQPTDEAWDNHKKLQEVLDRTDVLVGHNLKFDLSWLLECSFTYDKAVYDTKLWEYVSAKGMKTSTTLQDSVIKYGIEPKKDILSEYLAQGINTDCIPRAELEEYGRHDVSITHQLYRMQREITKNSEDHRFMAKAVQLSNDFLPVLVDLERTGIKIDIEALTEIEAEYAKEEEALTTVLKALVYDVMGDNQINLSSSEQMSEVVYGFRVNDKEKWAEIFNLGTEVRNGVEKKKYTRKYTNSKLVEIIRNNCTPLYKQEANQCETCKGTGYIRKVKKDGTPFKKDNKCTSCGGCGLIFTTLPDRAGFRIKPLDGFEFPSAATGGFSTSGDVLSMLVARIETKARKTQLDLKALDFLTAIQRLNAISTYRTTFCEGIRRGTREDGLLHTTFNQTVAATGRLTSTNPNFQNLPRANNFPIRKVIVSRFKDGYIVGCDLAQLEFRYAAILANDAQAKKDILDKVDIHSYTAQILTEAGQPTTRQEAKASTFKPLYGGSSGTEAERTYYDAFKKKYAGISAWQLSLAEEALANKQTRTPTHRIYAYPFAKRNRDSISPFTQIVNYPVQGGATGDLLPVIMINLSRRMKHLKSKLILTVHDDIAADVHPEEKEVVLQCFRDAFADVYKDMKERYNMDIDIPIDYELSIGSNWLNKVKIN